MNNVSLKLTLASSEAKKLRWCYDGALKNRASQKELDEVWSEYILKQRQVGELQMTLEKIGDAKVEVAKAKWWMDIGVDSDEHRLNLSIIYPYDSPRIAKQRYEQSVAKASEDYISAANTCNQLELSLFSDDHEKSFEDSWFQAEEERLIKMEKEVRDAEAFANAQAELVERDAAEVIAWTEEYLKAEAAKNSDKRKKLEAEFKEAEDAFSQKVNEVKHQIAAHGLSKPEWSRIEGLYNLNKSIW